MNAKDSLCVFYVLFLLLTFQITDHILPFFFQFTRSFSKLWTWRYRNQFVQIVSNFKVINWLHNKSNKNWIKSIRGASVAKKGKWWSCLIHLHDRAASHIWRMLYLPITGFTNCLNHFICCGKWCHRKTITPTIGTYLRLPLAYFIYDNFKWARDAVHLIHLHFVLAQTQHLFLSSIFKWEISWRNKKKIVHPIKHFRWTRFHTPTKWKQFWDTYSYRTKQ